MLAKPLEHLYRMWSQRKVYDIEKITRQNQKVKWQTSVERNKNKIAQIRTQNEKINR